MEIKRCFSEFIVKVSLNFQLIQYQNSEIATSGFNTIKILFSPNIIPTSVNRYNLKRDV